MERPSIGIPNRLIVLGGSDRAYSFAAMFSGLGATVTLIDERAQPNAEESRLSWARRLAALGCELLFGRKVIEIESDRGETLCMLEDGWSYPCDRLVRA